MVITSIWFFFWAKNGGFIWRKDDWDDYKSTVLRRKGKDGKTLSNATPATDLGEKSIAGTFDIERDRGFQEKGHGRGAAARHQHQHHQPRHTQQQQQQQYRKSSRPTNHGRREPSDDDLKAYRHEKPARVGGLNRQQDGSHFDFSSTEPSEVVSNNSAEHLRPKPAPARKKGFMEKQRERKQEKKAEKKMKQEKKIDKKQQAKRAKEASSNNNHNSAQRQSRAARHTFAADEASTVGGSSHAYTRNSSQQDGYFSSYRPPAPPHAASRRHETIRQTSPPKQQQSRPLPRHPGAFDTYSEAGSSDTGTKVYTHHIPGISRGSRDPGFRRAGVRMARRDSLDDSEDGDLGGWRR